jgi:hypothetical protein
MVETDTGLGGGVIVASVSVEAAGVGATEGPGVGLGGGGVGAIVFVEAGELGASDNGTTVPLATAVSDGSILSVARTH